MSFTTLYKHVPHMHKPRNVNEIHAQERALHANTYTRFNEKSAVWLTLLFSTMELFWAVDIFMAIWIVGNSIGIWHFDPMPFPLLLMVINIPQLPLLPLLAIGQSVLSRKQTLQADEQYQTTQRSYHDIEQIMIHLDAQDKKIIEIAEMFANQGKVLQTLTTELQDIKTRLSRMRGYL